ncbi:pancreatic lipase-related protein 2-like [Trichoplusia ni]|uniref:Pancreatic lipase-related protein 2-like n=1 Tax=Trichoplusia ni TaxID=7111 RepID=A0A7E5X554_TRINI|nr:pancreatic lipase-related protein 2-like [Trichoplusia ni]
MARTLCLVALLVAVVSALPADPVIRKLDDGPRYQYAEASDGSIHLSDMWAKASNYAETRDYNADALNSYHLFTRENPSVSQILRVNDDESALNSNFNPQHRTRLIIHGWLDNAVAPMVTNLVPAFLYAADENVIVVDWSPGSTTLLYTSAVLNNPSSASAVAKFVTWLNEATGARVDDYHIIGHGLGAHQAAMVGRHLLSRPFYITALDASLAGYIINDDKFSKNAGAYTESIHTNAGVDGYLTENADVDFYPNGGISMPGCASGACDHARSFFYFSESIYGGNFVGQRCATYIGAMSGNCYLWGTLKMGGIEAKPGESGIYHFSTNAFPPFAKG